MPTRNDILAAIKQATGNPDTGAIHEWTPAIADAVDKLCNGVPETNTKTKTNQETRLMGGVEKAGGGTT